MKKLLLLAVILSVVSIDLWAQEKPKVAFDYELTSNTYFDNRENDGPSVPFTPSMTLFGQALTPMVGVSVSSSDMTHRFMLGVDATFYFGSSQKPFGRLDKVLAYYRLDKKFSDGSRFRAVGGVFPKTFYEGDYTRAFVSDSSRFVSRNCQGLSFYYEREKFFAEMICNWCGMKEGESRERFQIWSAAQYDFFPWMSLGYAFSFDHLACSDLVSNVADNHLLRPYLAFDLSSLVPFQKLYADIGAYVAYQRNREYETLYIPTGVELNTEIRNWNVGVRNTLYVGNNLMPLYHQADPSGKAYAGTLFKGDSYYRVRMDGSADTTYLPYDRLELFYEPYLCKGVRLNISLVFHFNGGLSGTQQIIGLKADLKEILKNFEK